MRRLPEIFPLYVSSLAFIIALSATYARHKDRERQLKALALVGFLGFPTALATVSVFPASLALVVISWAIATFSGTVFYCSARLVLVEYGKPKHARFVWIRQQTISSPSTRQSLPPRPDR